MNDQSMELRRKHVEAALAAVQSIGANEMGAFRGRLLHLRNIGCPKLPKPGSGQTIAYTPGHALEMLIALELENVGQSPRFAAELASSIVRQSPHRQGTVGSDPHGDMYAVVRPSEDRPRYTMAFGGKALNELMDSAPRVFSMINVSACARGLFEALEKALATDQ
jgi:hypothetical protein